MDVRHDIFFVTEAEYLKLQVVCPDDFPFTYAQFVARVDEGTAALGAGARVTKVLVNVASFLEWCAERGRQPINTARAEYAAQLASRNRQN
jgi:hypothetical protein